MHAIMTISVLGHRKKDAMSPGRRIDAIIAISTNVFLFRLAGHWLVISINVLPISFRWLLWDPNMPHRPGFTV